jgi:orotidine-5'-phosphate decarboxylase
VDRIERLCDAPALEVSRMHFADALIGRTRALGHPLCAGLDPHLDLIPPVFRRGEMLPGAPETAGVVEEFLVAVVDHLVDRVAIVKPQIAFFEQLGAAGIAVLERIIARARTRGLYVLLDAKRGDIGSTSQAYAQAYFAPGAPCEVEAITLSPYLGLDSLEPFVRVAEARGRGLFVLVKTSNAGSGDLQDQEIKGRAVFEVVARSLEPLASRLVGPDTGWSSLGAVVGATYPEQAERIRELMPRSLFLVPGYGAQSASAIDAVRSFVPGPNGREGGIVNSSRGLTFSQAAREATDAAAWERALLTAIDEATSKLGEAVSR